MLSHCHCERKSGRDSVRFLWLQSARWLGFPGGTDNYNFDIPCGGGGVPKMFASWRFRRSYATECEGATTAPLSIKWSVIILPASAALLRQKVKGVYSSSQKPISEIQSITCHMGSHSIIRLPPDTDKCTQPWSQLGRLVLDLPTPEGWKAELTWVGGYILFTCPQTVNHPSSNHLIGSQIHDLLTAGPTPKPRILLHSMCDAYKSKLCKLTWEVSGEMKKQSACMPMMLTATNSDVTVRRGEPRTSSLRLWRCKQNIMEYRTLNSTKKLNEQLTCQSMTDFNKNRYWKAIAGTILKVNDNNQNITTEVIIDREVLHS